MGKAHIPGILYSTGTELACRIAKQYYGNIHYVWCTTAFDSITQPGTSNPKKLCIAYLDQILKNDVHASAIENNKAGILRGAKAKIDAGVIDLKQYEEIRAIIACAQPDAFFPVVYIIHSLAARKRCVVIESDEAAGPRSIEYRIEDLNRDECDIILLRDIISDIVELPSKL